MDPRVSELHCIMPVINIQSVLMHGILSYERAAKLKHHSVAMQPVQDKRDQKAVPGGLRLHQYANLYFHARNPMLFLRRGEAKQLCVLRVSTEVLQLDGTVLTDENAASNYVRFLAPSQWRFLDFDDIYARDWTHPDDQRRGWKHKSRKCAEVLIRHVVQAKFLVGAHVVDDDVAASLQAAGFAQPVSVNPDLFFR
jgi:ssDNA thymidine ADP-ribosyltransferase, DarT